MIQKQKAGKEKKSSAHNIQKTSRDIQKRINKYTKQFDFKKILKIEDTPKRIALSFTIGVFVGFLPLLWFHIFILIPIIILFRVNKLATLLGTFIIHPLSMYVLTPVSYKLGLMLLGKEPVALSVTTLHLAYWPLFIGSVALGIVFAVLSYPIAYYSVIAYRKRKKLKEIKKNKEQK